VNATGVENPRVKLLAVICEPSAVRVMEILKPDGGRIWEWIKSDLMLEDWWRGVSRRQILRETGMHWLTLIRVTKTGKFG
jgi:hypothetical protein